VAHVSTASLAVVSVAVACPPLFHTHMHSTLPPTHPMVPSCGLPPGTLFASERHTLAYAPGDKGWIISDNDWPGQLFSFLLEADGQHWRGVKVRRLLGGGGGMHSNACHAGHWAGCSRAILQYPACHIHNLCAGCVPAGTQLLQRVASCTPGACWLDGATYSTAPLLLLTQPFSTVHTCSS
jgi:hypothetical protein